VVTILLKTLPVVVVLVLLFKTARDTVPFVSNLPSLFYNAALIFALLLAARLTAGRLLSKLVSEGQDGG
jgi:hypothetical protein